MIDAATSPVEKDRLRRISSFIRVSSDRLSGRPLYTTMRFNELFQFFHGMHGNISFCKVGIHIQQTSVSLFGPTEGNPRVYEHLGPMYSLATPSTCGAGLLPYSKSATSGPKDDRVVQQLICYKWLLGVSDYTEQETRILMPWLRLIESDPALRQGQKEFLELFGTKEQERLIAEAQRVNV